MSGGSYDYAYSKLDELDRWVSTLERMAASCRDLAVSDRANTKWVSATKTDVPTTLEDRASILVRAMLLEKAAKRLREAVAEVHELKGLMHDVEWFDSCDYGPEHLMGPLDKT